MWHVIKAFNRIVARNVDEKTANYLEQTLGGEVIKDFVPRLYARGFNIGDELPKNVVGYVSNENAKHTYPQIKVYADGKFVTAVTRKQDAFRIMKALQRDYKDIIVTLGDKE